MLICLYERPMHPYEVATTLRQRHKHESVRLNYGSLYAVVASLEKRGLIAPQETKRAGRLPERTVYDLTDAGRIEAHDWLTDLISTPVKDYPSFEAALSFLPALPPGDVVELLGERAQRLELELAQAAASRSSSRSSGLPRLFWVEGEFRTVLREAELELRPPTRRATSSRGRSRASTGGERSTPEPAAEPVWQLRPRSVTARESWTADRHVSRRHGRMVRAGDSIDHHRRPAEVVPLRAGAASRRCAG